MRDYNNIGLSAGYRLVELSLCFENGNLTTMQSNLRQQLTQARQIVHSGGVFAYPTESCFGLGCYPKNPHSVNRLLILKHRSSAKGLVIIGHDFAQLSPYITQLPNYLMVKMIASWPAAITWLVPAANWVPKWLRGESDRIAVRVPDHSYARLLCKTCDSALISTSANISGQSSAKVASQVNQIFDQQLDLVIEAKCGNLKQPSTIIDIETDQVIR